jgi:uncharacterized protein (UPF0332 family)
MLLKERKTDAQILLNHEKHAGSVNRCYYAVFYLAQALLLLKNIKTKTHKGILQQFSNAYIQTGELPENHIIIFRRVFQKRISADYDLNSHITKEEAESILMDTKEFLSSIKLIMNQSN